MGNSTFSGPIRSENGFKSIVKNSTTGAVTSDFTLQTFAVTITIAASGTTGIKSTELIPVNFIPMGVAVTVTAAATNNVTLNDIGTDADPDGFVDGIATALNSTGFKGFHGCNGVLGMSGYTTGASGLVGDEVEIAISGAAGGTGATIALKFFGISSDSPTA